MRQLPFILLHEKIKDHIFCEIVMFLKHHSNSDIIHQTLWLQ